MPVLNQIWTSPFPPLARAKRAILEEVIHVLGVSYRPAQIYPTLGHIYSKQGFDYQLGNASAFSVDRFSDIVEALYVAMYPLLHGKEISRRALPHAPSKVLRLGKRIVGIAIELSKLADPSLNVGEARRLALAAICELIPQVIPSSNEQGELLIQAISEAKAPNMWRTVEALSMPLLNATLEHAKLDGSFYVIPRLDPHISLVNMLLLTKAVNFQSLLIHEMELLPVLTLALSLGLFSVIPVIVLRERRRYIRMSINIYYQFAPAISFLWYAGAEMHLERKRNVSREIFCVATTLRRDLMDLLRAKRRLRRNSPYYMMRIVSALLEFLPYQLDKYFSRKPKKPRNCEGCSDLFELYKSVFPLGKEVAHIVTEAARRYPAWLVSDCPRLIHRTLDLNKPIRVEPDCIPYDFI